MCRKDFEVRWGESWKIVPADVRFWCEHPELTEAERCG